MENLLKTLIEQNERLIRAVEAVGDKIEDFENKIRSDLTLSDSSSTVKSIHDKLEEISDAMKIIGDDSILSELLVGLEDIKSAVEIIDSTVQVEAEALQKSSGS